MKCLRCFLNKAIVECRICRHVFCCSISCEMSERHPCELICNLENNIIPMGRWGLTLWKQKCISQLFLNFMPLSLSVLEALFSRKIMHEKSILALWKIAQEVDVWPDKCLLREQWLRKHAHFGGRSFLTLKEMGSWIDFLNQAIIVLRPYVFEYADQIMVSFHWTNLWRFIFSTLDHIEFLQLLSRHVSMELAYSLYKSICMIKITRTIGRDLFILGSKVLPPFSADTFLASCFECHFLHLPPGLSISYNRQKWESAKSIYMRWKSNRDSILDILEDRGVNPHRPSLSFQEY